MQYFVILEYSNCIENFYKNLLSNPEIFIFFSYRFLWTRDLTSSIAFDFRVGESTVRMISKEVCFVLTKTLFPLCFSANRATMGSYSL